MPTIASSPSIAPLVWITSRARTSKATRKHNPKGERRYINQREGCFCTICNAGDTETAFSTLYFWVLITCDALPSSIFVLPVLSQCILCADDMLYLAAAMKNAKICFGLKWGNTTAY